MSCVLAIGQFDGIHLGHQAVLRAAVDLARELDAVPLALSFSPHVDTVLHPDAPPLLLATPEQNLALVRACGIADLCLFPFSPAWAARPAADFFRALPPFLAQYRRNDGTPSRWPGVARAKCDRITTAKRFAPGGPDSVRAELQDNDRPANAPCNAPPIAAIVVGENFTCGARGTTTAADLPALAQTLGIPRVLIVPSVLHCGTPVSSTRIRDDVAGGDMSEATALLGRPFALRGRIVHGRAEGRQHGLPTANIRPDLPIRPLPGVYAARLAFPPEFDRNAPGTCVAQGPSSIRRFVASSPTPPAPPPSSLPTPASSLLTPDSSLLTPDSSLLTPDSSLLTPDSSLLTPNSSLLTPNSSLLTPNSSLLTPNSSLLTPNSRPAAAFVPDPADPAQAAKFGDVVEVHVPNAAGDWYGRTAEVQFLAYIRPYRAFPDQAAASAQIRRDLETMHPFWTRP